MLAGEAESVARLVLPAVVDVKAVGGLHADLLALRGQPLELDASQVSRLGGLGLQVLLAARSTWAHDAVPFAVTTPSEDFAGALALFGVAGLEPVTAATEFLISTDSEPADTEPADARELRS